MESRTRAASVVSVAVFTSRRRALSCVALRCWIRSERGLTHYVKLKKIDADREVRLEVIDIWGQNETSTPKTAYLYRFFPCFGPAHNQTTYTLTDRHAESAICNSRPRIASHAMRRKNSKTSSLLTAEDENSAIGWTLEYGVHFLEFRWNSVAEFSEGRRGIDCPRRLVSLIA